MTDQFVQGDTAVGPGEAPPLPKGSATALNEAPAPTEPQTPSSPPLDTTAPPAPAGPLEPAPFVNGSTGFDPDAEKYLMAPTAYPNEPLHTGMLANGDIAPTPEVYSQLDALRQAAADPTAPPGVGLMLQLVAEQLP